VEAAKELVGLYESIAMVDEDKIEDELDIFFNGVVSELMSQFSYFMGEFVEIFQAVDKNKDALLRISEIIAQCLRYYHEDKNDVSLYDYADEYAMTTLFKPLLKELVCTTKTAKYWDSEYYIRPIITIYPGECVEIISKKTNDFLENHTGRKYYSHAAQWLKLLLKIKDKEIKEKIQGYFNALFRIYNRRPALKDELKKAGIHPA